MYHKTQPSESDYSMHILIILQKKLPQGSSPCGSLSVCPYAAIRMYCSTLMRNWDRGTVLLSHFS